MTDRYQIFSVLASSSSSTIHQGWDKLQNRDVAIKRLHGEGLQREALLREARALYALRHPGIVTIYEYGTDGDGAHLVMEFIKGESLDQRLAKGPFNMADFKSLVTQTLEAMEAAHTAGLIHRDIKPENVMLPWHNEGHFQVKLIDFGLAQAVPHTGAAQETMEGSVYFMAPEQFGSGHVDARTDLYALGCVYYFALTGQLPFPGEEKIQVITAHLYPPRVALSDLRPDLSDGLCQWVERLMSVQPHARPASAAEALQGFTLMGDYLQVQTAGILDPEPTSVMILEEEELPPALVQEDEEETEDAVVTADEENSSDAEAPAYLASHEEPVEELPEDPSPQRMVTAAPVQDAPTARRAVAAPTPPAASRAPRKRSSSLSLIITCFIVIVAGQFALVSYFKYAGREERQQRLVELSSDAEAQGSDVDVRLLLEFLDVPATQDQAAKTLSRLRGGDYINTLIRERLDEAKNNSVCAKLVQILGQRRDMEAFGLVAPLTADGRADVRKAAWLALGRITSVENLPQAVAQIRKSNTRDHEDIEKALVTAIESEPDQPAATQQLLKAYREATDHPETRTLLFNILIRTGGDGTLDLVKEAIADPSEKLRLAAIVALSDYPTHEPLDAITTRFPAEKEDSCRTYLLLAARELVSKPGPSSQQSLFLHAQSLYNNAKDTDERRYVLNVIGRTVAPGTAAFFEDFAANADVDLRAEGRDLAVIFRNKLTQVTKVDAQEKTTVPTDKADYRNDGVLTLEKDILANWTHEEDWASWLIELPRNGKYEVAIYQAHASSQTGTYEVLLAGQTVLTAAVQTGGADDFKGFVVGTFSVDQPGIYRLQVKPKTIPAENDLFRVQKLTIKALP